MHLTVRYCLTQELGMTKGERGFDTEEGDSVVCRLLQHISNDC